MYDDVTQVLNGLGWTYGYHAINLPSQAPRLCVLAEEVLLVSFFVRRFYWYLFFFCYMGTTQSSPLPGPSPSQAPPPHRLLPLCVLAEELLLVCHIIIHGDV
jgi:hypothetical protein